MWPKLDVDTRRKSRGETHHKAKLTEEDIPMIRQLHKEGMSTRELARKFDVTQRAIYQVVAFISWRHIL
jgi:DNA invertase Pin-like site-specific DNA recombinase